MYAILGNINNLPSYAHPCGSVYMIDKGAYMVMPLSVALQVMAMLQKEDQECGTKKYADMKIGLVNQG